LDAHIVCFGDELTKGEILNSNAAYISQELTTRGLLVVSILTLPDKVSLGVQLLQNLMRDEGLYIITGGLGGTHDDLVRKIMGEVLNKRFVIDKTKEMKIREWYQKKKRSYEKADRMQASFPEGGRILDNHVGLAYGFFIEEKGKFIFVLPGVPNEMKTMWSFEAIPVLEQLNFFSKNYTYDFLSFSDISEYTLDRELASIMAKYKGVKYGTRAKMGIIQVRFESRQREIADCIEEIITAFEDYILYRGLRNIEDVVGDMLIERAIKLSVAESCTAGLLSKRITDRHGSSQYFNGGVVAYSNSVKRDVLDVNESTLSGYGAVSGKTALKMAEGVQKRLNSDIAISVTGIAGPEGGSKEKPVGTVYIAICQKDREPAVEKNIFPGDRDTIRKRSANRALCMLLRYLQRKGVEKK
jgi:nicotinamide-nucleotide amidase